jgi:hypothetical protein
MNRIILIGNGFDLAHGLKTSYADFIDWYWDKRIFDLHDNYSKVSKDILCTITSLSDNTWQYFYWLNQSVLHSTPGKEVIKQLLADKANYQITKSDFFSMISSSDPQWSNIENTYYRLLFPFVGNSFSPYYNKSKELNEELAYVRTLLIEYLKTVQENCISDEIVYLDIIEKLYAPFKPRDISIGAKLEWKRFVDERFKFDSNIRWDDVSDWDELLEAFDLKDRKQSKQEIEQFIKSYQEQVGYMGTESIVKHEFPEHFLLPNRIMLLNFNYTNTADLYLRKNERFVINHIHGNLNEPDSVIFGYGDELDENYKKILEKNDNEYLRNIKSVKYLESSNYRNLLEFMESSPYQIFIMGHSCGNSDRTLLNTLFEHRNCVSIKPFYHKWGDGTDNYMELVQNISRNFTDMKLMRDRVVNKTFCETI